MAGSSLASLEIEAEKRNIFVDDSDYEQGKKYVSAAKEIENILKEYIQILDFLSSASSGKLADNLQALKRLVDTKLSGAIYENYSLLSRHMSEYKNRIDIADTSLY